MVTKIETQKQLDAAIKKGESRFEFVAGGTFEIHGSVRGISVTVASTLAGKVRIEAHGNSRVLAWENSRVRAHGNSRVLAWENSRVVAHGNSHVVAEGNSHVLAWENSRVLAWENSRVRAHGNSRVVAEGDSHVLAWENSHVSAWENSHVSAWENSYVRAHGNSHVVAQGFVSVSLWDRARAELSSKCHAFIHSRNATATGGKKTIAIIDSVPAWLEYHGVTIKRGVVVLYKSVKSDFSSCRDRLFFYTPGTTPASKGWDKEECSKGLHFSPTPRHAQLFNAPENGRFVACPVKVTDILWKPSWSMYKVKAPRLHAPCWEVDIDGNRIEDSKQ